jgi:hypothetical protein
MNSAVFVCVLLLAILGLPMIWFSSKTQNFAVFFKLTSLFQISWLILGIFYWTSFQQTHKKITLFLKLFPLFLILMMGLSFHNSVAVIEGWLGIKTPFIRTPKFNIKDKKDDWKQKKYKITSNIYGILFEIIILINIIITLAMAIQYKIWGMMPFHLMLMAGYASVIFLSLSPNSQRKP